MLIVQFTFNDTLAAVKNTDIGKSWISFNESVFMILPFYNTIHCNYGIITVRERSWFLQVKLSDKFGKEG